MNENLNPDNNHLTNEDLDVEKKLRPLSFDDFTGQDQALENLKIFVEAELKRWGPRSYVIPWPSWFR